MSDSKALLLWVKQMMPQVEAAYLRAMEEMVVGNDLRIRVKIILDLLRASLDFAAIAIFDRYGKPATARKEVQFPYAPKGANIAADQLKYLREADRRLPGVAASRPDIMVRLESYQYFSHPNNIWLPVFMKLSNENKHERLTPQVAAVEETMRIAVGSNSFTENLARFEISPFGKVDLGGQSPPPGIYTAKNPLPSTKAYSVTKWRMISFEGTDTSALLLLKEIIPKIEAIVNDLEAQL